MSIKKLLIANRGEIAIRIAQTATAMGIETVGVYAEADTNSKHWQQTDQAMPLNGAGAAAYLNIEALVQLTLETGCDGLHPGYGFLSESGQLSSAVEAAGLVFIGPTPDTLALFGNKAAARAFAAHQGVPILRGTEGGIEQAQALLAELDENVALMLKAKAGGGGRGMRVITSPEALAEAWPGCQSEAEKAFGSNELYAETYLPNARHIEVQIIGDQAGAVAHLWERDCTLQRKFQKIIEIAPAPHLPVTLRERLIEAATMMAAAQGIRGLATFEFLVTEDYEKFFFIEANPRLQVEHTVTEAITGLDLVALQIQLASGKTLADLNLTTAEIPQPKGFAIEARITAEKSTPEGLVTPTTGTLEIFTPACGPGIRVDTHAYTGYSPPTAFDSLLAKLIVHDAGGFQEALKRTIAAVKNFQVQGIHTNLGLLDSVLTHPDLSAGRVDNQWFERHLPHLLNTTDLRETPQTRQGQLMGQRIDSQDPLAILTHGKSQQELSDATVDVAPAFGSIQSPMQATILSLEVSAGDQIHQGATLLIMEAMKMEHVISAPYDGIVSSLQVQVGDTVAEGYGLLVLEPTEIKATRTVEKKAVDLTHIRDDLEEVLQRHAMGLDDNRPASVDRRRKTGHRTARENIEDICDPGSFVEYGPLVIAAQRKRRSLQDLIENTPADGMLAGLCSINGQLFSEDEARCLVLAYDYTVLAGTQGQQNHRKKDRLFDLAESMRRPVVFFTEGGGGRPGDTDGIGVAGLDCLAFTWFARLSALVPLVGITTGRCFAGNAALLGCCDVVIATKDANIGMGGPAMIEGGGLGAFRPEEVGPMADQVANGVVDLLVEDEAEAVIAAKKYLGYFQGRFQQWQCEDQRLLRTLIPENRLRVYDVHTVIEALADIDSILELRKDFGVGMVTVLARVEGRPIGIIANNSTHLAGAIDSEGADKASRFMQLCDAFDIPLLFLCDCPGIMVGPEVEKTALVRHAARMFVTGANLSVPFFTIILRKSYGLGAQAMAGGSFKATQFTVSWPTGEFGGMGLEGAVKLGYRKDLAAIEDPDERRKLYEAMVERMYKRGKAVNTASTFEIDDVIDPADSRHWIMGALKNAPEPVPRAGKKRPCIDTW